MLPERFHVFFKTYIGRILLYVILSAGLFALIVEILSIIGNWHSGPK